MNKDYYAKTTSQLINQGDGFLDNIGAMSMKSRLKGVMRSSIVLKMNQSI